MMKALLTITFVLGLSVSSAQAHVPNGLTPEQYQRIGRILSGEAPPPAAKPRARRTPRKHRKTTPTTARPARATWTGHPGTPVVFRGPCTRYAMQAAKKYDISAPMIAAFTRVESGWPGGKPSAESRVGAMGCMQIMPGTADWLGMDDGDAWDPRLNVDAGTRLLGFLRDRFHGDLVRVAGAYYGGSGRVRREGPSWSSLRTKQMGKYARAILRELGVVEAILAQRGSLNLPGSWHQAVEAATGGQRPLNVLVLGASHVEGDRFTKSLRRLLSAGVNGRVGVRSHGVRGKQIRAVSSPGWDRHLTRLLDVRTDLVVLAFGTNEASSRRALGATYAGEIDAAIEAIRAHAGAPVPVVLVGGTYFKDLRRQQLVDEALEAAANEDRGTAFWSMSELISESGGWDTWRAAGWARSDQVHLSGRGYARLAEGLTEALMAPGASRWMSDARR